MYNEHRKIPKSGKNVDWPGILRAKEKHGNDFPIFLSFYI